MGERLRPHYCHSTRQFVADPHSPTRGLLRFSAQKTVFAPDRFRPMKNNNGAISPEGGQRNPCRPHVHGGTTCPELAGGSRRTNSELTWASERHPGSAPILSTRCSSRCIKRQRPLEISRGLFSFGETNPGNAHPLSSNVTNNRLFSGIRRAIV